MRTSTVLRRQGVPARPEVSLPVRPADLPVPSTRLTEWLASRTRSWHPAVAMGMVAVGSFVVLVAAILVLGLVVRDVLGEGIVGRWDRDVSRWLADNRTPELNSASDVGSRLAGIAEVPIGMTLIIGAMFALRRPWWASLMLIGILLEGAQYVTVTYLFARTRPDVHRLEGLIPNDSFPSGHTAAAVVVYCGLAILVGALPLRPGRVRTTIRAAAWVVAILCVLTVATSRLYRGMHFVTDAVAGVAIGAGCLTIALLAVRVGQLVADARARPTTRPT